MGSAASPTTCPNTSSARCPHRVRNVVNSALLSTEEGTDVPLAALQALLAAARAGARASPLRPTA